MDIIDNTSKPGIANENRIFKIISKHFHEYDNPCTIVFRAGSKKYIIENATRILHSGADTLGRKKADIVITDINGVKYPLSIKMDNASIWESADKYFSKIAEKVILTAIKHGVVKLETHSESGKLFYKIIPNIVIPATPQEKTDVVFGSDILPHGAIISKTFRESDFKFKDGVLNIKVSHIITKPSEILGKYLVVFLIRNDKTRNGIKKFPGIRVLASFNKGIPSSAKKISSRR